MQTLWRPYFRGRRSPLDSLDVLFFSSPAHLALYVDIQGHHPEGSVWLDPKNTEFTSGGDDIPTGSHGTAWYIYTL